MRHVRTSDLVVLEWLWNAHIRNPKKKSRVMGWELRRQLRSPWRGGARAWSAIERFCVTE